MSFSNRYTYPLFVFLSVFIMITISGYVLYQILPKNDNFSFFQPPKQNIYFLKTQLNDLYLEKNGLLNNYNRVFEKFQQRIQTLGFNTKTIYPNEIRQLSKKDILIIPDNYVLSRETFFKIQEFLKKGGNLIFNYHFGYFNENLIPTNNLYLINLTNLKPTDYKLYKKDLSFFTYKLLSPIAKAENLKTSFITLYGNDYIDLFTKTPDLALTNWALTDTPKHLNVKKAGILWHGFYKKGKWFYFNTPAYTFLDMSEKTFNTIFKNIFSYFKNPITLVKYPFLDKKMAVFISEDTEYKYKNMINFAKLAKEFDINTTLFCVAKLAQEHKKITKKASSFKNIEIASHSFSHSKINNKNASQEIIASKNILQKITKKEVLGFRPPREEINNIIKEYIKKANYLYVMAKSIPSLQPTIIDNFVLLPRHGTDDYLYLIEYNFNDKQILNHIKKETKLLTSLNTLYTLSVHTHLLSAPENIHILKEYFKFLKQQKIPTLKGKDLAKRAKLLKNISLHIDTITEKNIFIGISNDNEVDIDNFTFRIYYPNVKIKHIAPEVLKTKIKIININKKERFIDVRIKKLYPKSTISLIIDYE